MNNQLTNQPTNQRTHQVASYCSFLGTGHSDLFYRLLPAAISVVCLLGAYAVSAQVRE